MFGGGLAGVIEKSSPQMSLEASKKAIAESGYKGEKVVVLDSTDVAKAFLTKWAAIPWTDEPPKEKGVAYEDILWALLNTKEFLFNH